MEAEDVLTLPASSNSGSGNQNSENRDTKEATEEVVSKPSEAENKEGKLVTEDDFRRKGTNDVLVTEQVTEIIEEIGMEENMDLTEDDFNNMGGRNSILVTEQVNDVVTSAETSLQNGTPFRNRTVDDSSKSGVKRIREVNEQELPSIHVVYHSLTRASKRMLEELLQKWSEWQAETGSSTQDLDQVLESGEKTFFPAVRVGVEKNPSVSFWIDNQTGDMHNKGSVALDSSSAPLYDRGYAVGLTSADGSTNVERGLEIIDDPSRCFNCGSYSHALRDCTKPRDHTAVSSARKKLKSKRNQNSGPRAPTRYYQNAVGGKYDDLKPGTLSAETRQVLGLGELDPPPWLNRMREIGYPPGYLDIDVENQPSGIAIFGDEMEIKEEEEKEKEDGEIPESGSPQEPKKNKAVNFPGVNAPIPKNADEWLWARPSGSDQSWSHHSNRRSSHFSEPASRSYHHNEQRWHGTYRDDGPPGVDPVLNPSLSSYPPRFGHSYHSLDRARRDTLSYESQDHSSSHSWSNRNTSHKNYDSEYWSRDDYDRFRDHRTRR